MTNVLLLRTPEENGRDRYEAAFEAKGYVPLSVPVLQTVFVHVHTLRDTLLGGPDARGLSGVILTSKRAVEAWCESLRSIAITMEIEDWETSRADWRTVPFYVVGEATAAAASAIHRAFPGSMARLSPAEAYVRGGAEAGTAERLAEFILAEREYEPSRSKRMLHLTGDKNRETLPRMLAAGGVELESLEVYQTTGSSTFRADLEAALEMRPDRGDGWWAVHFAPSAAEVVVPALEEVLGPNKFKVAAIGPTTASHLRDALGVRVDVVATKPSPEALCSAIMACDGDA